MGIYPGRPQPPLLEPRSTTRVTSQVTSQQGQRRLVAVLVLLVLEPVLVLVRVPVPVLAQEGENQPWI